MALTYYTQSLDANMREQPNEYYRGLQQAFYDEQWENTSARVEVLMETEIGSKNYAPIEVWINKVIGNTSTFMKNGEDYRQLLFRNIDQQCGRGYMFKFENNYWLADFWNPSQGLAADILVRRCNNSLNIIDPLNGAVFSVPCVVDYDMTSPTILVNSYILTPNSHATVYVQANEDTLRLFVLNKRFMLNGRPFKLYAYQNALNRSLDLEQPPVLVLDLYLDELHAKDDIENNIADNGEYNYFISIDSEDMELTQNAEGQLQAVVLLNDVEVDKKVVWKSSNSEVVTIDENGNYKVIGNNGENAVITANLEGNSNVKQSIIIEVVDSSFVTPVVTLNPLFEKIRQYETINTEIQIEYNGKTYIPDEVYCEISPEFSEFLEATLDGNILHLTCKNISKNICNFKITVIKEDPSFNETGSFSVKCVSMLG